MFIDSRDLRLLAAQGLTMAEIARELEQPYFRVRKSVQLLGIEVVQDPRGRPGREPRAPNPPGLPKMPRAPKPDPNAERNARMASMYRQGLTLEKIGQEFGVTRERVRQLIRKQGVKRVEGEQAKSARAKAASIQSKRDAHYLNRHGLTFEQYKEARATGLLPAYRYQENAAKSRGVVWSLTLAQWLEIWRTSGKLDQRGRGKGKYLMSRIKDSGGYEIGNVHIQLATENSREAVKQWRDKPAKEHRGVFCLYPGLAKPYMAKVGKKCLGYFASAVEATQARRKYAAEHGLTMRPDGSVIGKRGSAIHAPMVFRSPQKSFANACEAFNQVRRGS